jgi:hypothetical protein
VEECALPVRRKAEPGKTDKMANLRRREAKCRKKLKKIKKYEKKMENNY